MIRLVLLLVAAYVGLAVGLLYSLAVGETERFVLFAGLLVGLAVSQSLFLSRRGGYRLFDAELTARERS